MICYSEKNENGQVALWHISESEQYLKSLLPDSFDAPNDKNNSHRLQSLATSVMARNLLSDEIVHDVDGRPFLKSSQAAISVSNTSCYAALAFSKSRAGVDIEFLRRDASRVLPRISTDEELSLFEKSSGGFSNILLWCLKEASFKMVRNQPKGMALGYQKLISLDMQNSRALMHTCEGDFEMNFRIHEDLLLVFGLL